MACIGTPVAKAQTPPPTDAAAKKPKAVKDQGEYDILTAAQKETDPTKKLALLKQWSDKYPDSDFKSERLLAMMQAYNQLAAGVMALPSPTPDQLTSAQSAAQALVDNEATAFAPEAKPAQVSDADWAKAKGAIDQQAHTTLGYVAMMNKNYTEAESQFKQVLTANPDNAQISYYLGSVIARQQNLARTPEALYSFAHAVAVNGPGALAPDGKKKASDYLKKAYEGWHGDSTGLPELMTQAAASALPPPGFTIKSVVDIEKEKAGSEDEFNKLHPDIALFKTLRTTLTADNGQEYFDTKVKDTAIPTEFKGKLITATPETNPKELLVAVENQTGDALLKFETPLKGKAEPGTALSFKGSPQAFQKEPYQMVFVVEKSDLKGWPVPQGAAPARRKAPVRRRAKS
jgi:tetratricopeptide (TPR) repeat protein